MTVSIIIPFNVLNGDLLQLIQLTSKVRFGNLAKTGVSLTVSTVKQWQRERRKWYPGALESAVHVYVCVTTTTSWECEDLLELVGHGLSRYMQHWVNETGALQRLTYTSSTESMKQVPLTTSHLHIINPLHICCQFTNTFHLSTKNKVMMKAKTV